MVSCTFSPLPSRNNCALLLRTPLVSVQSSPLRIPISPPDTVRISEITLLNHRLQDWGYHDNPREYIVALAMEYERASADKTRLEAWKSEKEVWIVEGDAILDGIQSFMCGGYLDAMTSEGLEEIWRRMTSVVFKVQYMMAAVEVRLDNVT